MFMPFRLSGCKEQHLYSYRTEHCMSLDGTSITIGIVQDISLSIRALVKSKVSLFKVVKLNVRSHICPIHQHNEIHGTSQ